MGILSTIPDLQSTALLGHNIKAVKQSLKPSKRISAKPVKSMIKTTATNVIGIGLIGATANAVKGSSI